ncbi:hypothetical protein ESCO_004072 [Escovopsis weberi]|uniref:Nuclear distribution protein n=1 Tax=Escovopsis weberi TaxID=150374 RepID=A0A0N0RTT9_ESCWE|nr:hypothetical protein ESCO_004072 [Escovopsis weberi]
MESLDNPLDKTTLSTISLLESRLLRIEHLLHGSSYPLPQSPQSPPPPPPAALGHNDSALRKLVDLDRRFARLLSDTRVYGELIKIYKATPDLFHSPAPSLPPSQLDPAALRSIVLAAAPSYPATLSTLTAVTDIPVPDPAASAHIISLARRIRAVEAAQAAQDAELADLRARSEKLVRAWFEAGVVPASEGLAGVEARLQRLEREMRRRERQREEERRL